ncbi:hypothetical protein QQ045_010874 [Rhodiola kirilowii]
MTGSVLVLDLTVAVTVSLPDQQGDAKDFNVGGSMSWESFKDGHTVVKFNHYGTFYFISGNEEHCKKNQKLVVVVLSEMPMSQPAPAPTTSSEVPDSSSSSSPPSSSGASSPSGSSDMIPSSSSRGPP